MKNRDNYNFYIDGGSCYWDYFINNNADFDTDEFRIFAIYNNKADRDSGELNDIAKHEVLRLAYEYSEYKWRFGN